MGKGGIMFDGKSPMSCYGSDTPNECVLEEETWLFHFCLWSNFMNMIATCIWYSLVWVSYKKSETGKN